MTYPLILLEDPLTRDYTSFIGKVLSTSIGIGRVDLRIGQPIQDSEILNLILSKYYHSTRQAANELGFSYTFEINVLFNNDIKHQKDWSVVFKVKSEPLTLDLPDITIEMEAEIPQETKIHGNHTSKFYPVVAVGGTFDHIHDGHKILLSMAVFLTKQKLIIGVTGSKLLENKKFAEVLQKYSARQRNVIDFLKMLLNVTLEFYEINDVCGPTGFLKNINALVVSEESSKGGAFVNNYRKERAFPQLNITEIKVVRGDGKEESDVNNNWKGKLSSTDIREREYKRLKYNHE